MKDVLGIRGRMKNSLTGILLSAAMAVPGLAGAATLQGCGGAGTRTIEAPVDEDPGQIPPTPSPVDPFPDAINYVRTEELAMGNNPYPGQIIGTGGYFSQAYTIGGQISYDVDGDAQLRLEPFLSSDPTLNVEIKELAYQPAAEAYIQNLLDEGRPVTLFGEQMNGWFDVYGFEDGVDPLANPSYEITIGDNLQPTGNIYVRPNTP